MLQKNYNKLLHRINAYIKNGWDKQLVDPDCQKKSTERSVPLAPTDGWQELTQVFGSTTDQSLGFTTAQTLGYFTTRIADDGLPAGDFKSVYKSALSLFCCGHVQKIEVCREITSHSIFIRADCLPEMKKDRVYKIELQLEESSFEISAAQCGCPAGRGPRASCKHIAALCILDQLHAHPVQSDTSVASKRFCSWPYASSLSRAVSHHTCDH